MEPSPSGKVARAAAALLLLGACLSCPALAEDGRPRPWRVLVVHSYDPGFVWTQNIDRGLREALADLKVVFRHIYLDAKRNPHPDKLASAGRQAAAAVDAFKPHLVVAADDEAQAYCVVPYLKGRADLPVIFCGVNGGLADYGYPASNVSGVLERFSFAESFSLAKAILPEAATAVYLSDNSETAGYLLHDLQAELARRDFDLRLLSVESVGSFKEWKRLILEHQADADVLALGPYHTLRDEGSGRVVSAEEVMAWTDRHNAKPTVGFVDFAGAHGILCGVLERAEEQGYLAGRMARETLLSGRPAGELPVAINSDGVIMINLRTAERFGVVVPYDAIEMAGMLIK